jgi:hypothetical protein
MLRKVFGCKTAEGTGQWRKVHIEDFRNFYCTKFSSENLKGRNPLGDLGAGWRIILKWVFDA